MFSYDKRKWPHGDWCGSTWLLRKTASRCRQSLKPKPAISKTRQTEIIARAIQFRILIFGNDSHKKDDGRYGNHEKKIGDTGSNINIRNRSRTKSEKKSVYSKNGTFLRLSSLVTFAHRDERTAVCGLAKKYDLKHAWRTKRKRPQHFGAFKNLRFQVGAMASHSSFG